MPLVSIGTPARRWLTIVTSATTSAPTSGSASSPSGERRCRSTTFEPCSGNSSGASGASASAAVEHRRQRVVVDDDRLGGVDRLRTGLGDDGGDDVADEAHLAGGEHRPVQRLGHHRELLQRRPGRGRRRRRGRRRPRPASTRASLTSTEPQVGVGDRRAHERDVQHARLDEVVDVLALAREQRRVFEPTDRVSEDRTGCGHANPLDADPRTLATGVPAREIMQRLVTSTAEAARRAVELRVLRLAPGLHRLPDAACG